MKIVAHVLLRWWWLLIICLISGGGCGLLAVQRLPPLYAASASVQLDVPSVRTSTVIQPLAAYAALVSSDSVLQPALRHFSSQDQRLLATSQVVVTSDAAAQIISIRVVLKNASLTALFANTLAHILVTRQNSLIIQEYTQELHTLTLYLEKDQRRLDGLNWQYEKIDASHRALLQQLSDAIGQEQNLENQDYQRQENLESERALVGMPFSIVQEAVQPTQAISPLGPLPLLLLALCFALAAGCGVIWLLEKKQAWIYDPALLQRRTGLMLLGNLRSRQKKLLLLPVQNHLKDPLPEDSRLFLANTLLMVEEKQARLLTITGLRDSSDSSMIALHLAGLLAQCRRSVLLIDANLENPVQHIWNEKPLEGGLVELLELAYVDKEPARGPGQFQPKIREPGLPPIGRYLQRTTLSGLQLLPAGRASRDPATILGMPALPPLLRHALNFVDFVIIDCPAFSKAEVHLLGASSDQVLLVVNSAHDRLPGVEQAIEHLSLAGMKPGGLIVIQPGK